MAAEVFLRRYVYDGFVEDIRENRWCPFRKKAERILSLP